MLVTRQYEAEANLWPFAKYDPPRKLASPRMSNQYNTHGQESTPSSWQGHQSQTTDEHGLAQRFGNEANEIEKNPLGIQMILVAQPLRSATLDNPNRPPPGEGTKDDFHRAPDLTGTNLPVIETAAQNKQHMGSEAWPGGSQGLDGQGLVPSMGLHKLEDRTDSAKEEEDEEFDDEDMLDGEGENQAQTPAERAAARRKMKRFRSVTFAIWLRNLASQQVLTVADSPTSKHDFS